MEESQLFWFVPWLFSLLYYISAKKRLDYMSLGWSCEGLKEFMEVWSQELCFLPCSNLGSSKKRWQWNDRCLVVHSEVSWLWGLLCMATILSKRETVRDPQKPMEAIWPGRKKGTMGSDVAHNWNVLVERCKRDWGELGEWERKVCLWLSAKGTYQNLRL